MNGWFDSCDCAYCRKGNKFFPEEKMKRLFTETQQSVLGMTIDSPVLQKPDMETGPIVDRLRYAAMEQMSAAYIVWLQSPLSLRAYRTAIDGCIAMMEAAEIFEQTLKMGVDA